MVLKRGLFFFQGQWLFKQANVNIVFRNSIATAYWWQSPSHAQNIFIFAFLKTFDLCKGLELLCKHMYYNNSDSSPQILYLRKSQMLSSLLIFLIYFTYQLQFPSLLSFHSFLSPPIYSTAPSTPPPSRKRQNFHGCQQSMSYHVLAGPSASPCIKAGWCIPAWGISSQKPTHDPGTDPDPTAKANRQTKL